MCPPPHIHPTAVYSLLVSDWMMNMHESSTQKCWVKAAHALMPTLWAVIGLAAAHTPEQSYYHNTVQNSESGASVLYNTCVNVIHKVFLLLFIASYFTEAGYKTQVILTSSGKNLKHASKQENTFQVTELCCFGVILWDHYIKDEEHLQRNSNLGYFLCSLISSSALCYRIW